ncbi:MAG TPA: primosomal protein N', partial [Pyrinomonadaceae bacterium]|nr:primosomal protein N' [Pyrinomonadaceae bacterium]
MQQRLGSSRKDSSNTHEKTYDAAGSEYVDVAVPVHVLSTFTYRLPPSLRDRAQPGSRIVVPFGGKPLTGYILGTQQQLRPGTSLHEEDVKDAKEILDDVPLLTPELLQLTRWVSEYYLAPLGEVIKAALPPGITPPIERFLSVTSKGREAIDREVTDEAPTIKQRLLRLLSESDEVDLKAAAARIGGSLSSNFLRELTEAGLIDVSERSGTEFVKPRYQRRVRMSSDANLEEGRKLTPSQEKIIQSLKDRESLALADLLAAAQAGISSVNTLEKRKIVEVFEERLRRDPLADASAEREEDYVLTEAQKKVLAEIDEPLRSHNYAAFLLHGVTGSGKTEVYIRAMRVALSLGRSALMLVPEIALTPVFSRRLKTHFGDKVAIFHSSLSRGQRFDEWGRVRTGDARIVIGTRSAVFAPIKNLGLVIVDEEHESTYRQQDSPHYNGRDTAIVRAQQESAVVILGSATPSLESFHNANTGKYRYLQLPERLGNRPLAEAEIIDMRTVFARHQKPRIFSDELLRAIEETHRKGEQSIILLNRRGYSSFVLCRSCGESIQCPNCDVTLTYHRSERVMICHYCNHRQPAPSQCPNCEGKFIYYVGEGTQQIEEILTKLFPDLRIARIDRDTTSRRGAFEKSLFDFSEGKIDLLVGTQ